jgi:hypothetical protein
MRQLAMKASSGRLNIEHQRLRDAVVKAVKARFLNSSQMVGATQIVGLLRLERKSTKPSRLC